MYEVTADLPHTAPVQLTTVNTRRCSPLAWQIKHQLTLIEVPLPPPRPPPPRGSLASLFLSCWRCFFDFRLALLRALSGSLSGLASTTEPPCSRQWRTYHACCCLSVAFDRRIVTWGTGLGSWVLVVGWKPLLGGHVSNQSSCFRGFISPTGRELRRTRCYGVEDVH